MLVVDFVAKTGHQESVGLWTKGADQVERTVRHREKGRGFLGQWGN
jgi:hypothetical protein